MNLYQRPISPNASIESVKQQRSKMRKHVSKSLLALLRLGEPLLTGSEMISSETEFISKWISIYQTWLSSQNVGDSPADEFFSTLLNSSNQTTVDGNCHAVCEKLSSLVESGFKVGVPPRSANINGSARPSSTNDEVNRFINPSHTSAPSSGVRKVNSAGQVTFNDTELNKDRPPLLPFENPWQVEDNNSRFEQKNDDGYDSKSHISSTEENVKNKKEASRNKNDEMKSKKSSDNRLKKKSSRQSSSDHNKSTSVVSPDFDTIAKFAATKEMSVIFIFQYTL
jgi:hypothetical protein